MPFFDDIRLATVRIRHMVFHLVGPRPEDLVLLEAIDPGAFSEFFLERIRSVNAGTPYRFSDASATRERLARITKDPLQFQTESEELVRDFQRRHGGTAGRGAFLLFQLAIGTESAFALLKYDDETVVSYQIEPMVGGRGRVALDAVERTFVQNRNALQKSALVRLTADGGELTVVDRQNPQKVARYFEGFLDAIRLHEDAELTDIIAKAAREVVRDNPDLVPRDVKRQIARRAYDAASKGGSVDGDDQKAYLEAVVGTKLPHDDPLVVAFQRRLRRDRIDGVPITLDPKRLDRPRTSYMRTKGGITITIPDHMRSSVTTGPGGRSIIIEDEVANESDIPEGNRTVAGAVRRSELDDGVR